MDHNVQNLEVKNNAAARRFEVQLGDKFAFIDYHKNGPVYTFTHTAVPAEHEGQGIAAQLTQGAFEMVKAEGGQVVPACPYTKTYLKRHPEYESLVVPGSH